MNQATGGRIRLADEAQGISVERRNQAAGSSLSPALRSWIKNCLVPVMVDQYLAERKVRVEVAFEHETVRESPEAARTPLECDVQ